MKVVVAAVNPTLILCWRASGLASPVEVPASTLPALGIAPVRARMASRSVVLPLWKGPTSAMHRGPRGLLASCPICRLLLWSSARDWVGGLDGLRGFATWQAGKTSLALCPGRAAAFFTLPRRAGTVPKAGACYGPGSAAHRFASATRCAASGERDCDALRPNAAYRPGRNS